jgi:hypothetical protein
MRRVLLIMILGLAAGCGARTSAGDQSLIDQADSLHRTLAPAIVSDDPRLRGYMQQIAARLLAAAREVAREQSLGKDGENSDWMFSKEVQFHIARSTVPNAFTAGGHHVYVLLAAFGKCQSEDELAAALAHAYSHTLLRHIQHHIHAGPPDAPASSIVLRFAEHRFTLKQEQEADDLAFAIYTRAGWDPPAFLNMLEHLESPPPRIAAIGSRLERLPPAAQEWSRPPITDVRRFGEHREQAGIIASSRQVPRVVERLLAAFPNCFAADDLPQQKEAQRELSAPISTETPNTFEKGPRERRQ